MVVLKRSEQRKIDEIFDMQNGYVLGFSNRLMAEFFEDEFDIEIYDDKYSNNGTSKANRLRTFIQIEDDNLVAKVLEKLLDYKRESEGSLHPSIKPQVDWLIELIKRLQLVQTTPAINELNNSSNILSLDTVVRDIHRATEATQTDPESAVTSACSLVESMCRSILIELGEDLPLKKDLKSLFNAVKKPLGLSPDRTDMNPEILDDVRKVLSGLATLIEGIGALRTHGGDAHGREKGFRRIDARIANLAVNSASTTALFLMETWQKKFPSKTLRLHGE